MLITLLGNRADGCYKLGTNIHANLEEIPTVKTNLPSIDGVKISMDKLDDKNFLKNKLEMERELEDAKILGQD